MSNNSRVPLSVGKTVNTVKFSDRFSVPPILLWLRDIISAATRAKLQTKPAHMKIRDSPDNCHPVYLYYQSI